MIVATLHARAPLTRLCADCLPLAGTGLELVVVDGGSDDGSEQLVGTVPGARWRSEPDTGIADAWNKALRMATGDWLVFAGADDRLGPPDAWQRTLDVLDGMPQNVSLVAFAVDLVSPRGAQLGRAKPPPEAGVAPMQAADAVPHQGLFVRREVFARVGGFDSSFLLAADYDWLLRALLGGAAMAVRTECSPVSMTFGGLSTHEPLRTLRERRRAQEKQGARGPRIAWWPAWARAYARHILQKLCGRRIAGLLADCGRCIRGLRPIWSVP